MTDHAIPHAPACRPAGPDWWSASEHKRVLESLLRMKGNSIAFHTYPYDPAGDSCGGQGPTGQCQEPTTWIGLAQNVNADGTVNYAYPSSWSSTQRATWGYTPANTSSFAFGAAGMYEHECFGHPLQSGNPSLCPLPVTQPDAVELFNAVGAMWQDTFAFAHAVGVQNFLGTEIPISTPPLPATTLLPLSVWYSAERDDHFVTTTGCAECEGLYVNLGTIGWVYASNVSAADLAPGTTLVALSTYYSNDYTDNILTTGAPPDGTYGFVRVEGYALATGNGSTAPLYQSVNGHHHFAVSGSTWITNATAEGFSIGSVMGQVFTSGPEPPTKQDWYEGVLTRLDRLFGDKGLLDYYWVWTPEAWEVSGLVAAAGDETPGPVDSSADLWLCICALLCSGTSSTSPIRWSRTPSRTPSPFRRRTMPSGRASSWPRAAGS